MALQPWFEHMLPPGQRPMRRAIARDAGIDPDDGFALLAWLGDDLPGAARMVAPEPKALKHRRAVKQPREATTESAFRSSLAGAQWKLSLAEDAHGISLPIKGTEGEWIGKFHTGANPAATRREYGTTRWAAAAGVHVPEHRLIQYDSIRGLPEDVPRGDGNVYLVRRFDRTDAGRRVHAEDFGQILDLPFGSRIFSASYEHIAKVLHTIAPREDLRSYVRQLVFCILSGNNDAHVKNWAVIYPDGVHARLSPGYDLTPTILVPDEPRALAATLNRTREAKEIHKEAFDPMASIFRVSKREMHAWVTEDAQRTRDAWRNAEVREVFSKGEQARLNEHMALVPL